LEKFKKKISRIYLPDTKDLDKNEMKVFACGTGPTP